MAHVSSQVAASRMLNAAALSLVSQVLVCRSHRLNAVGTMTAVRGNNVNLASAYQEMDALLIAIVQTVSVVIGGSVYQPSQNVAVTKIACLVRSAIQVFVRASHLNVELMMTVDAVKFVRVVAALKVAEMTTDVRMVLSVSETRALRPWNVVRTATVRPTSYVRTINACSTPLASERMIVPTT